jgi:succinate-semialdehyde dehydrogenase/glutarate-semialdehyde dehydrogenase
MEESALLRPPQEARGMARLLIEGRWCEGSDAAPVYDKYHLRPFMDVALPSRAQVAAGVAAAQAVFKASDLDNYRRGVILDRAANLLEERRDELVRVLCREAGFPGADAAGEVRRTRATFRLSAEEARRFAGEMVPLSGAEGQGGRIGFTLRVPLGVVCAVTPFNAPLNTVAHKIAPALAAGNSVILKPSLHTPMSSCILAEVLIDAGLPPGLISVIHGGPEVVNWLLDEPVVRFLAFTGSTEAGRAIQARAGLRRTQMELGSLTHCILCADADLDRALPKIVAAGFRKAGQVCTSVQVLLVEGPILEEVEQRLTKMVAELRYGDPADIGTAVGPVISETSARRIEAWIDQAVEAGARKLTGGPRIGAVVPPTLLSAVPPGTPLGCQEVFGPVMCISAFERFHEALDQVNSTPFGLAAGIFTRRLDIALSAVRRLDMGGIHINETSSSRVDMMPYGGTKESGFGREGPRYAVHEMSEERMVTLHP